MLLRRGVIAALAALMVAAPSAVALTDSVPASNTECPAGGSTTCPDQAGVDTIAGDSGSTGAEGTDSSTDQPGGDQPTGGGQPGDGGGGNESGAGEAKGDPDAVDTGTKIDLCKFEPWNIPGCDATTEPPCADACPPPGPCKLGTRSGVGMACPPITPCSQGDVQPYPDCVTTDPTIDPPALPDCKTSEADGDTYCPLPGSPCELKVSTQEKGCPGSIDPPVDCAAVKFASEEAANAAGCGPSTDPPTPSGIRVCETDKATGDRSCRTLNQGEFGCFETEAGPWICIDPPPVDPPPLCETDASSKPERCDGPAEGGGCFTTADGNRACYDKVVPVVVPHPKPTDGHPKEPKGRPQPKPENRSAGHADKTVKGKPKSGGDRSGKDKPKAANGKKGKRKKGKSRKAKAKAKSKRAASKPSR